MKKQFNCLIEISIMATTFTKVKEILSTTNFSIAEVTYKLGFEHPQSFN
jgi:transcriptional regulator GlxA family with amidase domain